MGGLTALVRSYLTHGRPIVCQTFFATVGLRVARFGLFEAKRQIWPLLKFGWPKNFREFIKQLAWFQVYKTLDDEIQNFSFL